MILDQHSTFFKLTMLNHFQDAMLPQNDVNPTTRLWERIVPNGILNHKLFKWFKMAKLCNVIMLGNMEDECTFSNLAFMKTKFQNWLITHFDLVVCMYVQKNYTL